jgi:hypothetical protein
MPLEYVSAPPVTPAKYGILSAAVVVEDSDPHGGLGFEYQPDWCGPAQTTYAACLDPTPGGTPKIGEDGLPIVEGEPFAVYHLTTCRTVGAGDLNARAQTALSLGEGRAVEQWLGAKLAAEADDRGGTWTAETPWEALAAVEHFIHCNYGGVGTIHMQRGTASGLLTGRALDTDGTHLTTRLGNIVSAGCYDVSSGDVIYATGTVMLRRGPTKVIQPPPDLTNEVAVLAERPYAGGWECFAIGVHVVAAP